jgi:hypothetical protein
LTPFAASTDPVSFLGEQAIIAGVPETGTLTLFVRASLSELSRLRAPAKGGMPVSFSWELSLGAPERVVVQYVCENQAALNLRLDKHDPGGT